MTSPYKSSKEAFAAIHESLAHAVEVMLADAEYDEARKLADMMKEVEQEFSADKAFLDTLKVFDDLASQEKRSSQIRTFGIRL